MQTAVKLTASQQVVLSRKRTRERYETGQLTAEQAATYEAQQQAAKDKKAAKQREQTRLNQLAAQGELPPDQAAALRAKADLTNEKVRRKRAQETDEEREARLVKKRAWEKEYRANLSPTKKAAKNAQSSEYSKRPDVRIRLNEAARGRYAANQDGMRDKVLERSARRYAAIKADPARMEAFRQARNAYQQWRRDNDPQFAARNRAQVQLHYIIRRAGEDTYFDLVGCTSSQLVHHLESTMQVGMHWDQLRKSGDSSDVLEIDHIIPCKFYDLTNDQELQACYHFSNLQLLWRTDNRRKSARLEYVRADGEFDGFACVDLAAEDDEM